MGFMPCAPIRILQEKVNIKLSSDTDTTVCHPNLAARGKEWCAVVVRKRAATMPKGAI